jgi:hypothetical protein
MSIYHLGAYTIPGYIVFLISFAVLIIAKKIGFSLRFSVIRSRLRSRAKPDRHSSIRYRRYHSNPSDPSYLRRTFHSYECLRRYTVQRQL